MQSLKKRKGSPIITAASPKKCARTQEIKKTKHQKTECASIQDSNYCETKTDAAPKRPNGLALCWHRTQPRLRRKREMGRLRRTNQEKVTGRPGHWYNRWLTSLSRTLDWRLPNSRAGVERYYSRKKGVFLLGEERTRGIKNFETNCYLISIMEYLEYLARILALFTKLRA